MSNPVFNKIYSYIKEIKCNFALISFEDAKISCCRFGKPGTGI